MGDGDQVDVTALDLALIGAFFISCTLLALVQLKMLYDARFLWFALIFAGFAALPWLLAFVDFAAVCAAAPGAFTCGNDGRGFVSLISIWPVVCVVCLAMFGLSRLLSRIRGR